MDFQEADRRYQELHELLASGKLSPVDYDKAAAQLRVLGEDGVWWAVHPRNGKWLRWDGKAWQDAVPPHRYLGESPLPKAQDTILLEEKPPVGVILKGEEAIRQLLEIRRICEEMTPQGAKYFPVDLKPGGLLRGIAYKLNEDGSLEHRIAILYAAADSAEGKKLYIGGHWVIVPSETDDEHAQEPPTEKQLFTSLVREMIDSLEISYQVREKIKDNLDLSQVSLADTQSLPEQANGWWQVHLPAAGLAGKEFQQTIHHHSQALKVETRPAARRKLLEEVLEDCERSLETAPCTTDQMLQAGFHAAMASALVELGEMQTEEQDRLAKLHLAEDHAEMVEWLTREAAPDLATYETLKWLAEIRKKAVSIASGVQAQALQHRLDRIELTLAQVAESYLTRKKQALRDLYAARALYSGSRFVEQPEEKQKVLAVSLWQAQAAQQQAQKIGDAALTGQCLDALAQIEAELIPLRGDDA